MPRVKGIGGHHSAAADKDEWITPRHITDALGPFSLDPCAPVSPPWDIAPKTYNKYDNGLLKPWNSFVWCNPPYGQDTGKWLARMNEHGNGIALVFARTETEMFFQHGWEGASSMLFLEARLYFHHVDGRRAAANSGAPSVLLGYGPEADIRLRTAGLAGAFVRGWTRISAPEWD